MYSFYSVVMTIVGYISIAKDKRIYTLIAFGCILFFTSVSLSSAVAGNLSFDHATASGWYKEYGPQLAIDGDWNSVYAGTGKTNRITAYLKKTTVVSSIALYFSSTSYHRPRSYTVEACTPAGKWRLIAGYYSNSVPDRIMIHRVNPPLAATAIRVTADTLSTCNDNEIVEILINKEPMIKTNHINMPRPEILSARGVRVQPFDAMIKFYHHGDGMLFYAQNPVMRRVEPILVVSPLAAGADWFTKTYGEGRFKFSAPFDFTTNGLTLFLSGPENVRQIMALQNESGKCVLKQICRQADLSDNRRNQVNALGLVLRLPVEYWQGAEWTVFGKTGTLSRIHRPVGVLALPGDWTDIYPEDGNGGQFIFKCADGNRQLRISCEGIPVKAVRIAPRSGTFGHFFDIYIVVKGGLKKSAQVISSDFRAEWNIIFDGDFVRPWWRTFGFEKEPGTNILSTSPAVLGIKQPVDKQMYVDPVALASQIMDTNNGFYGAVTIEGGDRINRGPSLPLATRELMSQLVRRYLLTSSAEDLKHIAAALDYLSSTVAPWGQYGDIRWGGWCEDPFMWNITGHAQAVEVVRQGSTRIEPLRLRYWMTALRTLYRAGVEGLRNRIAFKNDIGANVATYSVQVYELARYFRDTEGQKAALQGMDFALSIGRIQHGLQRDYSYSHGNQFDTGYYRWLLEKTAEWRNLTKNSEYALSGESLANYYGMVDAFKWLYDNGLLNSMTSHPKNRLVSVINNAVYGNIDDAITEPLKKRMEYQKSWGTEKIERLVVDDSGLPLGQRWFDVAGLLVDRNIRRYISIWWNANAFSRDDIKGANANYNAKIPLGAFYLRYRDSMREVCIPADNIHYSGAVLVDGMYSESDWATGFPNYKDSVLSAPVKVGSNTVLAAVMKIRSAEHPQLMVRVLMTTVITPEGIIRVISSPEQQKDLTIIDQALVLRDMQTTNTEYPVDNPVNKTKTLTLNWRKLYGNIKYYWTLSSDNIDGAQLYSHVAPAKVWQLKAEWPASKEAATAWAITKAGSKSKKTFITATSVFHHIRLTDGNIIIAADRRIAVEESGSATNAVIIVPH